MSKKAILVLLVSVSFLSALYPQQKGRTDNPILFRGVVIALPNQERLGGSQIFVNRSFTSVSKPDGTFSIYAFKKDTVVFTSLGYKPASLMISDTLRATEFLTGVYLQSDTIEIGEIIILPRLSNLKAEMMNPRVEPDAKMNNAKSNITIASYQGRTTQGKLGDPSINYQIVREKQKIAAFERGGIPTDKMVGLNPFILIPAVYLLVKGMPEVPKPPEPRISDKELDELNMLYKEYLRTKK